MIKVNYFHETYQSTRSLLKEKMELSHTNEDSAILNAKAPQLAFAFEVRIELARPMLLQTQSTVGERAAVYIQGGSFKGPNISGRVVPASGADWAVVRPDSVLDFDARYLLEAGDGTLIYLSNRGYRWSTPEVMARMKRGEPVADHEYYMRVSPRFEVAQGPHDWLNRHVFVGVGRRLPVGNAIRYYQVL